MRASLCVVDTNVPILANDEGSAGPACRLRCVKEVERVMQRGRILLDTEWRILKEYMHKLSPSGQPGLGDAFLKWVLTQQANPEICKYQSITPRRSASEDYEEFPRDPALAEFDAADRKFVAVAAAHPENPMVLQGFDSKWWGFRKALEGVGVAVNFLCPEEIESKYDEKIGARDRVKRRMEKG